MPPSSWALRKGHTDRLKGEEIMKNGNWREKKRRRGGSGSRRKRRRRRRRKKERKEKRKGKKKKERKKENHTHTHTHTHIHTLISPPEASAVMACSVPSSMGSFAPSMSKISRNEGRIFGLGRCYVFIFRRSFFYIFLMKNTQPLLKSMTHLSFQHAFMTL